jgi:peptide/nickel transport system ATP-binding protein
MLNYPVPQEYAAPPAFAPQTAQFAKSEPALADALLRVRNLTVRYGRGAGPPAVNRVSFSVSRGETFGLVGESGSGKSSAALAVARLIEPREGEIFLGDLRLSALKGKALRAVRHRFQMIFQDPASSLNPRERALAIVSEPMILAQKRSREEIGDRARELLAHVGLPASSLNLFPFEFSGGQRQRLAIARAISTNPELLILDEPVSALDAAIQAQILNLLAELEESLGVTGLFISHDLAVIQRATKKVGVMRRGSLIEIAPTRLLFEGPVHPYTWALLAASLPHGSLRRALTKAFAPREAREAPPDRPGCDYLECPLREEPLCSHATRLEPVRDNHLARCHKAAEARRIGARALQEPLELPALARRRAV